MAMGGLNRTSVGLKQKKKPQERKESLRPQSNQRGIETRPLQTPARTQSPGLNRTSVGLKQNNYS